MPCGRPSFIIEITWIIFSLQFSAVLRRWTEGGIGEEIIMDVIWIIIIYIHLKLTFVNIDLLLYYYLYISYYRIVYL